MGMVNFWLHAFIEPDDYPSDHSWCIELVDWWSGTNVRFSRAHLATAKKEECLNCTIDLSEQEDTYPDLDKLIQDIENGWEALCDVMDADGTQIAQYTIVIWSSKATYSVDSSGKTYVNWEFKHRVFFENLKETDMQPGKADQVLDLHIGDYLVKKEISEDSSIQDVLISAIHREESAIKFFEYLAGRGGTMQPTFERLAGEEKKHKLRLETFYDDNILTED